MERRLIDANALLVVPNVQKVCEYDETGCYITYKAVPVEVIEEAPSVDAVEVVRCRDCKRHRKEGCIDSVWCGKWGSPRHRDDYCSYGERREPDGE